MLYLGEGRSRIVFLSPSGKNVIKVPLNEQGIVDNMREASHSKRDGWLERKHKARCRLMPDSTILIMEYVERTYDFKNLPRWIDAVDCQQVGYTLKGRLVAYDFA